MGRAGKPNALCAIQRQELGCHRDEVRRAVTLAKTPALYRTERDAKVSGKGALRQTIALDQLSDGTMCIVPDAAQERDAIGGDVGVPGVAPHRGQGEIGDVGIGVGVVVSLRFFDLTVDDDGEIIDAAGKATGIWYEEII